MEAVITMDAGARCATQEAGAGLADLPLRRDLLLRLLEIGFLPGERVRVVARAFPAGEPLAVRIGRSTFALRRREAALVRISTTPPATGNVA